MNSLNLFNRTYTLASLAIALVAAPTFATTIPYTGVNGRQQYNVPATASYVITASGAAGGGYVDPPPGYGSTAFGGSGATMGATFYLSAGTKLDIYVAQRGGTGDESGGGGGATWVAIDFNGSPGAILIAAGGGSGAGPYSAISNADFGYTGTSGGSSYENLEQGGNPGGGGGYSSAGASGVSDGIASAGGGGAFPALNGGYAGSEGAVGGFGGGGGGSFLPGGGGGYNGGDSGQGGGSFIDYGTDYPTTSGATDGFAYRAALGDGSFNIDYAPEPASIGLVVIASTSLLRRARRVR